MKLSIIVPLYNVEKYIDKCLYSLLNQDIDKREYEIIVVNDGTKDNSASIAKEIAAKHDNIIIINKENGGLSSARNLGIDYAKGEYIFFVDSDDFIESNVLNTLLNKCYEEKLDMLSFNYREFSEAGESITPNDCPKIMANKPFTGVDYLMTDKFCVMVWLYLYRREFLKTNDLRFILYGYEDENFTPRALYFCKRILFMDIHVYNYLLRTNSYTKVHQEKNSIDLINVAISVRNFSNSGIIIEHDVVTYLNHRANFLYMLAFVRAKLTKTKVVLIEEIINSKFCINNKTNGLRRKYKNIIRYPRLSLLFYRLNPFHK